MSCNGLQEGNDGNDGPESLRNSDVYQAELRDLGQGWLFSMLECMF